MRLTLILALTLSASMAGAQTTAPETRSAATAAKAFSLDLPPTDPVSAAPVIGSGSATAMVAFTLDTPIGQLLADPRAKAVLDQNMPGLSDDANLAKFRSLSLRQFQPMTGGQMTKALLDKTGADLAAIGDTPAATVAPSLVLAHPASNKRMDSGR